MGLMLQGWGEAQRPSYKMEGIAQLTGRCAGKRKPAGAGRGGAFKVESAGLRQELVDIATPHLVGEPTLTKKF